jgi:hypothetical protein
LHKGKQVSWSDLKEVQLTSSPAAGRVLSIYAKGALLAWANCNLDEVANDFILVELIRASVPPQVRMSGA